MFNLTPLEIYFDGSKYKVPCLQGSKFVNYDFTLKPDGTIEYDAGLHLACIDDPGFEFLVKAVLSLAKRNAPVQCRRLVPLSGDRYQIYFAAQPNTPSMTLRVRFDYRQGIWSLEHAEEPLASSQLSYNAQMIFFGQFQVQPSDALGDTLIAILNFHSSLKFQKSAPLRVLVPRTHA